MSFEPNPPQRPRLWDAWSHSQLAVFGLLLFGADQFWRMVVFRLVDDAFAASVASCVVAVILPCAVAAWWHGETLARAFQLRPGAVAILAGIAGGLLAWAPTSYLASLSAQLHPPSPEDIAWLAEIVPHTPLETAVAYLAVSVAAPLGEELIFRGILFRLLRNRWGWGRAAVLTALFFGVVHLAPWNLFGLVALGLVLALLYMVTRSLLAPVFAHAAYNTVTMTVFVRERDADPSPATTAFTAAEWLLIAVSTVLLAALLLWLWRRFRPEDGWR